MKIGMFDSGVGGLTVLKEFLNILPNNEYIYFGDTKRVPYGGKSKENIKQFSIEIIEFLIKQGVELIVVACGSVSSTCLDEIKDNYNIKIIGVVEPTIEHIVNAKYKNIGVIGTKATINSEMYLKKLEKHNVNTVNKACPLFVPIIEENVQRDTIVDSVIDLYLSDFAIKSLDGLVLGCTHYPIIEDKIREYLIDVNIINPALQTAMYVKNNIKNTNSNTKTKITYYFSDLNESVFELGNRVLGFEMENVKLHCF